MSVVALGETGLKGRLCPVDNSGARGAAVGGKDATAPGRVEVLAVATGFLEGAAGVQPRTRVASEDASGVRPSGATRKALPALRSVPSSCAVGGASNVVPGTRSGRATTVLP